MSVFNNPDKVVTVNSYNNYLKRPGFYRNCKAVHIEEMPATNQDIALRIDWAVDTTLYPDVQQVISDFIPRNKTASHEQYIVNHAYDLLTSYTDQAPSKQQSLAWAEKQYTDAVTNGAVVNIELTPVVTKGNQTRYNITYSKPSVVAQPVQQPLYQQPIQQVAVNPVTAQPVTQPAPQTVAPQVIQYM